MDIEKKPFNEFLGEAIKAHKLNIEKLAELTDVPKNYLSALIDGDFEKLPAAPFVRGYLIRISEVLKIDGEQLWEFYKEEIVPQIKTQDSLPFNRFAIKRLNKKKIIIGIISFFFLIYLVWQGKNLFGIPKLEIINPESDNLITSEQFVALRGKLGNPMDKILINEEEIFTQSDGSFEKEYSLQLGLNIIEFKAQRFLGKETKVVKAINYQP